QLLAAVRRVIHVPVHRQVLVQAPAGRDVVDDDVPDRVAAQGVVAVGYVRLAAAEAEMPYHHVVGVHLEGGPADADAVAGGRLAGDRDVRGANADAVLQVDDAGHVEHDDAGADGVAGLAERSGPAVRQAGHHAHLAAAAAEAVHAGAPRPGERGD